MQCKLKDNDFSGWRSKVASETWTFTFGAPRRPRADARLRADARGRDGGVREELAAGMTTVFGSLALR